MNNIHYIFSETWRCQKGSLNKTEEVHWRGPQVSTADHCHREIAYIVKYEMHIDSGVYSMTGPLPAIDTLFKSFLGLHANYPFECRGIWQLLQQEIYGIYCEYDVENSNIETLRKEIRKRLQWYLLHVTYQMLLIICYISDVISYMLHISYIWLS